MVIDPNSCCGKLCTREEGLAYHNRENMIKYGEFIPLKSILSVNAPAKYLVCGDNTNGFLTICQGCVVKLGLKW